MVFFLCHLRHVDPHRLCPLRLPARISLYIVSAIQNKLKINIKTRVRFAEIHAMLFKLVILLCYRCCLKKLVVVPVALHLVRINQFQYRCHGDNSVESAPNVREAENRQVQSIVNILLFASIRLDWFCWHGGWHIYLFRCWCCILR